MDRETRVFAESHFRGLRGRLPSKVCPTPDRVDFIEKPDSFSYTDFFKSYLLPNVPCVFSSAFTEDWGSRKHWVTPSGKPDFDYLLQNYGDVVVPVANCGVQEYNSNPKEHMPLKDYISYWKEFIQRDYSSPRGCLYLKDWHLCRYSSAEGLFTLPVYFSSDWLNEYWDTLDVDDYRFIYMGPAGTWCQVIMKSCSGINFEEFYQFLKVIAERRLLLVKKISPGELQCSEDSGLGLQHTIFDISRIAEVLASVVVNPDFQRVDTSRFLPQPEDLLQQLQEALATTEPL
ncbi:jmjC domain-containing protein 4 [Myotis lucifugus]|uniref:jmjC domain-containing protein 4 n=1 Tax=Myotis lucifugus TaxID=59463 RepID=UPI0003C44683|nr:jmjC domain-containing protein 4 [Myotis lucifugus]